MNDWITIIRVDGTMETHTIDRAPGAQRAALLRLLDADTLDMRTLRKGAILVVDDAGLAKGKPVNWIATMIYYRDTPPRAPTRIVGDVAIIPE